jgi:predicted  nucleic acid-binding Zn-ribbon protein
MAKSKKMILTYTPEVTPAPALEGETPSGIRVNWKAKAERLQTECVALGQSLAAVTDRYNTIRAKMTVMEALAESREKTISLKTDGIKILKDEVARLEKVIGLRARTIERLTAGIDQYQKDIAGHVDLADMRNAALAELNNEITRIGRELKAMTGVRDDLWNRLDSAFDRFDRIPRWIRNLFGAA